MGVRRESGVSSARRKRKGDCERLDEEARGESQTRVAREEGRTPRYVSGIEVYDRLARRTNPGVNIGREEDGKSTLRCTCQLETESLIYVESNSRRNKIGE